MKERRLGKRLTQAQLAKIIGVSSQTLLRYEKLERSIPTGHLLGLQEVLGPLGPNDGVIGAAPLASESRLDYAAPLSTLPLDEDILLRLYRSLSRPHRHTVLKLEMRLAGLEAETPK